MNNEFTPNSNREDLEQDSTDTYHVPGTHYPTEVEEDVKREHGEGIGPVGGVITRSPDADPTPQTAEDDPSRHPGMGPGSR